MASSSSSLNWKYDVFLSFSGGDVRRTFLSFFLKELDRKSISAFKDNEIKRSHSLGPELVQAIRNSRIAVVIFSKNYASSSWCLNELLEIVNCKDNIVIPVFYDLNPSHVRHQTGHFGRNFQATCKKNTKEKQNQWKKALTDVAIMAGYHSANWDDELKMIEVIANDVLGELLLTSSKDSEDLVGIEAHIAEMSLLLQLESEEVRMVGIWGSSGIGKTTIARALFNRLSGHFESRIFIDRAFLYNSLEIYGRDNPDDPNMRLHLQNKFLSEILGEKDIKIDHLDATGERLQHKKVLIIIDDLDDQVVLDTLVGQTQWFGCGSRIIVVTNDKRFLRALGIDHIYEVSLPSEERAQEMLCRSAFNQNYAPQGFEKLVVSVVRHSGNLPSVLNLLGKYLRGRDKEFWMDTLPRLEYGLCLDDEIEKRLRISYDGLGSAEDRAIFRHIACLFNHMEVTTIKSLLADSNLGVNIALQNLADKSLIHVRQGYVVMHHSLQEMGRKIVRTQSIDKPGKREFLVDPNDICYVLSEGIGTQKVLGISLDTSEIDELHVDESAFKGMRNLRFLKIDSKNFQKEGRVHLPERFDYLPPRLKLLCWPNYPMSCMPSNFRPENLVKLEMWYSKLHKLWEGVVSLTGLKVMDMWGSKYLKEIPDLSEATDLEILRLGECESLVELPSSIRNLNKLLELDMRSCKSLVILPTGFNLKSLEHLNFNYCSELRTFPEFSTNMSELHLFNTNIEEFPSNLHLENLVRLTTLKKENDGKQWEGVKQKFLIQILMTDDKTRAKALKNAVQFSGVIAVEIQGVYRNQMVVTGDGIDIVGLIMTLRKKVSFAELVSVNKVEPPKDGFKLPNYYSFRSFLEGMKSGRDSFLYLDNFLGEVNSDATINFENKRVVPVIEENKDEPPKDGFKLPDEYYFFRSYLESVEDERDRILWDKKSDRNPKEAEIVQAEAKSRRFVPVIEEKDFVGHLVKVLKNNGVNVDEFPSGDIHFKGIEESRMALIIFSSRYAESRWFLNELVKIKELMEEGKLLVIPIFYKVEPLEVTQLKGDFGVKFWNSWRISRDHHIIEWKEALKSVASIKGIYLKEHCSESEFITLTVNKVVDDLSMQNGENPSLFISTGKGKSTDFSKHHLFGMEQRMEQLEKKLELDCDETLIIGVVGMPGIGKTTLAMMLHEKWNRKFLRCVPLLGIRKKSEEYGLKSEEYGLESEEYGLEWLRKTLLEVLLEEKFPAISDKTTHETVKDKLLQTKVFVVLDDVSNKKQLEFLLSDLAWIKKGSKIIITTSDQSLLNGFADDTFVVPLLNDKEAFQLFTYHAFDDQICSATRNFKSHSRKFVDYARGHPQALILLGAELRGKDEAHWEHRLGIITDRHNTWIQDIWRFSTDQLNEQQRDVFLDIVYFFKSEDEYFVRSLVDSGDPDTTDSVSELRDLSDKFLITVSDGRVEMHNLLYRFSKGLVSPLRHRLWNYEDIINKLQKMEPSDAHNVRGIFLDISKLTKGISLDSSTFIDMRNLRYLKIYDSSCPRQCIADCKLYFKELEFSLEEVRYLHWLIFPLKELPKDFRPENLVDLRLPHSNIERVWKGVKDTPRLKWVDLSHSSNLLDLSALSKAENLQRLNLEGCTSLDELPLEIQNMKSLVFLNLRGCIRLCYLPNMNLISLKTLILSDCSSLKEFQLISESVEFLHLDGTAIEGLPPAIQNLWRLVVLNLKNCKMLECLPNCLGKLKFLDELVLSGCSRLESLPDIKENMKHLQSLLIDRIGAKEMPHISCATISEGQASADMVVQPFGPREWPRGVNGICSLRRLCLSGNDFVSLQTDIGKLYNLNWLDVRQCKLLTSIPMLPPRLRYFDAHGCDSLERVANPLARPVLSEQIHATFNFSNCNKLDQDAKDSIMSYTRRKSELVLDAFSRYNGGSVLEDFTGSCFPGCEVPAWFSHQASGSLLKQRLPQHWCDNRFTGIALCAVILFPGYYKQRNRLFVKCKCVFNYEDTPHINFIYTIGSWREPSNTPGKIEPSHVFIGYTSTLDIKKYGEEEDEEGCGQTEASFEFQVTDGTDVLEGCEVLKCGFSLVYATDEMENIRWDAEIIVIPERIENILGQAISYGDSGSRDDIHYESYSGLCPGRDEKFLCDAKSDATPILQKSLENKEVDLLNEEEDAGREIIDNTSSGNLEKLKMHSLVGVELRLKQMEKVLYSTPGKTRIVGVVGMPGSGKTTLATILFEKRGCKFPSHLFLTLSKECRLEQLRRVLLKELLKHVNQDIDDKTTYESVSVKDKLLQSKIFLVLDDVSGKKQLEFLLGNLNWIKKGSKIVITTRDKSLLEGLAHDTYVVQQLNNREAFQLFTYHAFYNQMCLSETLLSLSKMFVDNVPGNPLDLKLLGSHLCGKDEAYWQHELRRVRQNFSMKMREVWTFSIDNLNERQRDVFLDIVYFFKSEDENFVKSILDSGNPEAVSEVRDLADKFLITISGGRVEMHDQLYTLGKDLGSPEQHRLCNNKDIINKVTKMKKPEANNVRGIFLDMSQIRESIALKCMTFADMRNLLYLKIYDSYCPRKCNADCNLYFPDGLEFPLEEVRYLHWVKFPLQEFPPDFRPENLVDLRLPYSKIERVWEGVKDTPQLKWVDLRHSSKLLDLSALSKAENLQRLNLEGCTSLDELPLEIQNMKSLFFLNLRGCIRLCYLPKMNLISLKTLILSDCSSLKEFQLISESVEFLHLDGTAIEGLPPAIQNLRRLVVLNLKNCKMLECLPNCLGKLKFLDELVLSGCSRLKSLPDVRHSLKHLQILLLDGTRANEMPSISCFTGSEGPASADISVQPFGSYSTVREYACGVNGVSSLRRLCLSGNDFVTLQPDIGKLYNLNWLDVQQCKKLIFVPTLPPRLQYFNAHGCDSLERVANPLALPVLSEQNHASFNFSNCNKLDQDAKDSIISYTRWRSQLMLDELTRYDEGYVLEAFTGTCFPGWEVPAWFSDRAFGLVLKPKLPLHLSDNMFTGIALCAVIPFHGYHERLLVKCKSVFNNEDEPRIRFSCTIGSWSESNNTPGKIETCHIFIGYISMLDIKKLGAEDKERFSHTSFEFQVTDGTKVLEGCEVLKCGFSLVYATDELQVKSAVRGAHLEANHYRAYSKNVAISEVRRETEAADRSPDGGDKVLELPNKMITLGIATSPQPPIAKYPVSPAEYGTGSNNSGRERQIRMFDVDPRLSGEPQHHNDDLIHMVASSSEAGNRQIHSQVFISYHEAELHRTFVRHLVSTLTDAGVSVFTDNDKGNGIKQLMQLYQRIEESKIALVIFSKRYVESNICLNELVMMDELAKEGKLLVIPVFYNVRSSDVRNLKGEFGLRFKEMRKRYKDKLEKVLKWETSMRSIAKTIGIDSEVHGEDAHLVEATVEAVQRALTKISEGNPMYLGSVNTPTDHVFALFATFLFCLFTSPLRYNHAYSFRSGVWLVGFLVMVVAVVVFYQ